VGLTWPLVGRRKRLVLVDQATAAPGSSGVALAGAAGVGKTPVGQTHLNTWRRGNGCIVTHASR
jgi:hypothetical protein